MSQHGAARLAAPPAQRSPPSPALSLVLCATAALVLVRAVHRVLVSPKGGLDFRPLYEAGLAVRSHQPLYAVANFVYPPVAAFVAEPLGLLPLRGAFVVFTLVASLSLVAACAVVVALVRRDRPWAPGSTAATAALVLVLFATRPTLRSLDLGNASLLLPLTTLVVCCLWGTGRWHAGTAVLVASLVVKPVLLPLVLVPLVRGRWRPLALWAGVGAIVVVAALEASAGIGAIPQVVDGLLHATHFTGRDAPLNLSLAGFAGVHPVLGPLLGLGRVVVIGVAAGGVALWALSRAPSRTAGTRSAGPTRTAREETRTHLVAATALLTALLLVGSISEVHYVLVLVPGLVVVANCGRRLPAALALAAAAAYVAAERSGEHVSTQALLVAVELLVLVACSLLLALEGRAQQLPAGSGAAPASGPTAPDLTGAPPRPGPGRRGAGASG